MKKILVITMLLVTAMVVKAQTITITSFGKAENDLEITVRNRVYQRDKPYTDGNGDPCALIKITRADNMPEEMLKRLGAKVTGQVLHPKYVEEEGLYFYVTYTSDQLTVFDSENRAQHQSNIYDLKKYFQYVASEGREGLDPNAVYEMTLKYSGGGTSGEVSITQNYLLLKVEPKEAMVQIDGKVVIMLDDEYTSKMLSLGEHKYSVSAGMYHTKKGVFKIEPEENTVLDIRLQPNYGYLSLESKPSGAMVYINGEKVGTTPYESERMRSGSYQLQLVKEMYSHTEETIIITDEQTTRKEVILSADFAEVTVTTDPEADIYVNNEKKAKGSWNGRLEAGVYVMEARRTSHRTTKKSVTLVKGENKKIEIESPEPIYGNINVNSTPVLATIKIDGKEEGATPQIVRNVLIGSHEVEISKEGCKTERRMVEVEEGKTAMLEVVLETGREITVTSTPLGAEVYVDGKVVGKTPLTKTMSFGSHRVKVVNGEEEKEQTINVTENGSTKYDFDVEKGKNITITSTPSKAKVYIDGKYAGKTPCNYKMSYDNHRIFVKKGLQGKSEKVKFERNSSTNYDFNDFRRLRQTFVTVNVGYVSSSQLLYGISIGSMMKMGWYVSYMSDFTISPEMTSDENGYVDGIYPFYSEKEAISRMSVMVGGIWNVAPAFGLRIGVGYGSRLFCVETEDGKWVRHEGYSEVGMDVSAGLQLNLGEFILSFDAVTTNFKTLEANVGLGFGLIHKK